VKGPKEVRDWINERRETAKREAAEYALAALQCQRHDCQALRAEVELLKVDLDETIKDSHKQLAEVERLRDLLAPAAYWLRAFDCGDVLTMEGQEAVSNLIESIEIAARLSDPTDGSR